MARVLIVSNRLPITTEVVEETITFANAAGGLATGLPGSHERTGGLWIGWPGLAGPISDPQRDQLSRELRERGIVPVHLTADELQAYYEEFSNGVIWPLFHYLLDRLPLGPTPRDTYRAVNQRFAEETASHYQPGDVIWVHDYQLMLVPGMLRQLLPDARIGFFLHIPFPAAEIFRILPWRREILQGLLGADLIGFHTYSYVQHFTASVADLSGLDPDDDGVWMDERRVRFGVFPMGIDAEYFSGLAQTTAVQEAADDLRAQADGRTIFLGVDRLDYTKGIPRRLLAFEALLRDDPALRERVRLVQVAVPSREQVTSYQDFRREVEELIGRINGAYGTLSAVPIHYLYQSIDAEQLVALYRAADVMLGTPLRDGMNLVAKEFIASRVDEDGVLVLSEFAGAADELQEAVSVNAYDVEGLTAAMRQALDMAPPERQERMRAMRRRVAAYDVHRWADHFLRVLAEEAPSELRPMPEDTLRETVARLRSASPLAIMLDYDGTLVPIAPRPEEATPDDELLQLLDRLSRRPDTMILMVSGRARDTLESWFGAMPIELWAEHGTWHRPVGGSWTSALTISYCDWLEGTRTLMEEFAAATPGAVVEAKSSSVAWHYRLAGRGFGRAQARELRTALSRRLVDSGAEVIEGKRVLEVRPLGATKGAVVQHLLAQDPPPAAIVAFGDDRTDEEMFAALPRQAVGIRVGPGASLARYRLRNPAAVRAFLEALLD